MKIRKTVIQEVMLMYDYQKLRGLIKEHFNTLSNFAKAINMGTTTLNSRLQGTSFFDQMEIELISKKLDLSEEDVNAVFFSHK